MCVWSVVQPLHGPYYTDLVASLGTVFIVFAALFSGAHRTTIGSIYKMSFSTQRKRLTRSSDAFYPRGNTWRWRAVLASPSIIFATGSGEPEDVMEY